MIIDKELRFSDNQEVTATAASAIVADAGSGDLGASPLELVVLCGTDATGSGSLVVSLETSDKPDTGFTALAASRSLVAADLKAGSSVLPIQIPRGAKRYLRLNYAITGTLKVVLNAFLVLDRNSE